jgi:hypothetical protein
MDNEQENPKKKHSLGITVPPKRPVITVVVKGGLLPSDVIDGVEETRSEVNSESNSESIVVLSGGGTKGSFEHCCDGVNQSKDNQSDSGVEVTNEENSSQK